VSVEVQIPQRTYVRHNETSAFFTWVTENVNKNQTDVVYLDFQKYFRFSQKVIQETCSC